MSISITDLLKLKNPNIIDIRPIENYNNNHIPGSKNISSNSLILDPNKYLSKSEIYYIYCKRGQTTTKICKILQKKGFKTINIIGGYEAWILQK